LNYRIFYFKKISQSIHKKIIFVLDYENKKQR